VTTTNPEQWAVELAIYVENKANCPTFYEAALAIQAAFAERDARLVGVLQAFTDCARYDPHMDGSSSFMGWRHSELRRVEELARATLAALKDRT
jgi:hypothetical protein